MAPKRKSNWGTRPRRPQKTKQPLTTTSDSPNAAFVRIRIAAEKLRPFGKTSTQLQNEARAVANRQNHEAQEALDQQAADATEPGIIEHDQPLSELAEPLSETTSQPEMDTRKAWSKNLANRNRKPEPAQDLSPDAPQSPASQATSTNDGSFQSRIENGARIKPILKNAAQTGAKRRQGKRTPKASSRKSVTLDVPVTLRSPSESSVDVDVPDSSDDTDKENIMADRPKLKLKFSQTDAARAPAPQTPNPQTAIRTPSLKLSFGSKIPSKSKTEHANGETPGSSAKKRKHQQIAQESDDELARPAAPTRKLTIKVPTKSKPVPTPASAAPLIKLKAKGKIPKRPLGVGYDSELEDKEIDPVILEGFILRMQPGPDADYVQTSIANETVGISRIQGGADIRMRLLDTHGRRGILIVRGNQYAITMVDLPCVVEGMKSWDKRGFIKSIDITQMMLVLGACKTDDEARHYPLPEDVDPNNYQYAHGLTAPMKWVRKRRFARTKRARVDDIEAIERRVHALLEADKQAHSSRYELLDHDPRQDEQYSEEEYDDEEDAEGEDEEPDNYFGIQNGHHGAVVETPTYAATPAEDIADEDIDEVTRMLEEDDVPEDTAEVPSSYTLHLPEPADSSFAITSTSASPSAPTAAQTPASAVDPSSDEDEDDAASDEDRDDEEKEGDENLQQVKDRIQDIEQKIAEQKELLKKTPNAILKRKLAQKISDLDNDAKMMRRQAGLADEDDE